MKNKYSPFKRYYIITDIKNNFYWVKNILYGYNYQNHAVFEARFSDKFIDTPESLEYNKAQEVLEKFKSPHIVGGCYRADTTSLEIQNRPCIFTDKDLDLLNIKDDE